MNYTQAIAWLYDTQPRGIKLGLEQIQRMLDALGFERKRSRFLHVAGTNGKGSVCAMLDSVCRAQGIRTGLYTSPHLVSFCERIKLDGAMISEEEVASGLTKIHDLISSWETHPTFFEITTALALEYFQRMNAGVVVLETGLGGRLDSTNVVVPAVSVLTAIDLDHQAWLGNTLAEIATEKAGIMKPGVPVVSAPQHDAVRELLIKTAAGKNAPIEFITTPLQIPVSLPGSHQKLNAALALAALRAARIEVSDHAILQGLANVQWPGRFQIIAERFVLDGAHNEAATERLVTTWREIYGDERPAIILGVLKDKDMTAVCRALLPLASHFILVPVRSPRSSTPEELREIIHGLNPEIPCSIAPDLSHALKSTTGKALVTGSLFLVGEALAYFDADAQKPEMTLQ